MRRVHGGGDGGGNGGGDGGGDGVCNYSVTHFLSSETSPVLAEGEERRDYYGNEEDANQANDRGKFLSCIFVFHILHFVFHILHFVFCMYHINPSTMVSFVKYFVFHLKRF